MAASASEGSSPDSMIWSPRVQASASWRRAVLSDEFVGVDACEGPVCDCREVHDV